MPSAAAYSKVSEDYRIQMVAEEEAKKLPRRPVGSVASNEEGNQTVVSSFFDALDAEVVLPVEWTNEVPMEHPIRKQDVHVLLWGGEVWKQFNVLRRYSEDEAKKLGFDDVGDFLNWWLISVSTCDKNGKLFFSPEKPETLDKYLFQLRAKYYGPKHAAFIESVSEAAMIFNGLKREEANRDAKKLDTTASSTSSGESSSNEDVPSEKPQPPVQQS